MTVPMLARQLPCFYSTVKSTGMHTYILMLGDQARLVTLTEPVLALNFITLEHFLLSWSKVNIYIKKRGYLCEVCIKTVWLG